MKGKFKYKDRNLVEEEPTERKKWRKAKRRMQVQRNVGGGEGERERGDHSIKRGERENVTKLQINVPVKRVISPNILKLRKIFENESMSTVRDFPVDSQKLRGGGHRERGPLYKTGSKGESDVSKLK